MLSQSILDRAYEDFGGLPEYGHTSLHLNDEVSRTSLGTQYASGSSGKFTYFEVGDNTLCDTPKTDEWEGGCFACWESIPRTFMLNSISYRNQLFPRVVPRALGRVLRLGWNEIVVPVFGEDNLPLFHTLRRRRWLHFPDTQHRSLMEASLYFRLARSFSECLSYPWTAGMLRNRYPDAPAAVLLGLTSLGHVSPAGLIPTMHYSGQNTHIGGSFNLEYCASLVRNWAWASQNGGWRVDKLISETDTANPFSRRFYGHNPIWFGTHTMFPVTCLSGGQSLTNATGQYAWEQILSGSDGTWSFLDDLCEFLKHVYEDTLVTPPTQELTYDISNTLPWLNPTNLSERRW